MAYHYETTISEKGCDITVLKDNMIFPMSVSVTLSYFRESIFLNNFFQWLLLFGTQLSKNADNLYLEAVVIICTHPKESHLDRPE